MCWLGVYYCSRAFLPLLVASPEGYIVNASSLSGLVAGFMVGVPASAYGTAKFAVRGKLFDRRSREHPEDVYEPSFWQQSSRHYTWHGRSPRR